MLLIIKTDQSLLGVQISISATANGTLACTSLFLMKELQLWIILPSCRNLMERLSQFQKCMIYPLKFHEIVDKVVSKQVAKSSHILAFLHVCLENVMKSRLYSFLFSTLLRMLFFLVKFVIVIASNGTWHRFSNNLCLISHSPWSQCEVEKQKKLISGFMFKSGLTDCGRTTLPKKSHFDSWFYSLQEWQKIIWSWISQFSKKGDYGRTIPIVLLQCTTSSPSCAGWYTLQFLNQ